MEHITGNIGTGQKPLNIDLNIPNADISVDMQSKKTDLVVENLQPEAMELNADLTAPKVILFANLNQSTEFNGVLDIRVENTSIVENQIANLELGQGLGFENNEIILKLDSGSAVKPKNLSIAQQNQLIIPIVENGALRRATINDLDYTKLIVQDTENLSQIRTKDFVFVKED